MDRDYDGLLHTLKRVIVGGHVPWNGCMTTQKTNWRRRERWGLIPWRNHQPGMYDCGCVCNMLIVITHVTKPHNILTLLLSIIFDVAAHSCTGCPIETHFPDYTIFTILIMIDRR